MAFMVNIAFVAVLLWMSSVQGYTTKRLYATQNRKGEYLYSYNNNDRRSFYISPASGYSSSSHYLEITWSRFDIRGYMPYCHNDRVEVYLTRANKTAGRFCSYNAGSPFDMYSHDGHAKIELVSDSKTTGLGFTFYYRLRSKTSDPIRGSRHSTYCYKTSNYATSGALYSAGWPDGYQSSYSDCKYSITRSSSYAYTKFVFMDVDLGYTGDSVEIYGSSSYSGYKYRLYKTISTQSYIRTYTTTKKYLELEFERSHAYSSLRGFVLGYIQYGKSSSGSTTNTSPTTSHFSYSYLTPVIIVIILAVSIPYIKKRRQLMAMRRNNATVTIATHTTHGTAGINQPEVVPPPYPENQPPFSQSYPMSYDGSSLSTAPPPNYAFTVASESKPTPGNIPPPYPDFQSQYPAPVPYPPVTSAFSSDMQAPNAPPPSYDAAVRK